MNQTSSTYLDTSCIEALAYKELSLSEELILRLNKIKMLVMDVDGVLTDCRIWMDSNQEWKRFFSIRDGVGIKSLQEKGYKTAIITGSKSKDIRERAKVLSIDYFYEGALDKEPSFESLILDSGLSADQIAYIGDDVFDIPLLKKSAFAATVPEAVCEVAKSVHYVCQRPGGNGAVREICDLILKHGFYAS